ncbi:helix-turn-helix domain-containing protein [Roseovarius sp. EL26]|uniref:helix-turn-helix domain-containing protein n=1 Tax=Roseovarius sp. EL26 TaxID=2126672 RepID=UPI000EA248CC|nr:helix-turn-helix transcriptional regulator [Roseovarius sp. EL26]
MAHDASLFARKLKDWRARNGTHGRVTQEGLAEILGVSIEAISKYERSLSFIRGDLEHRLNERLGWASPDILACRTDWEARHSSPSDNNTYHLLDDHSVNTAFDGSWKTAARASIEFADDVLGHVPPQFAANESIFGPIYEVHRDHWCAVMCNGQMVAKWALPFLIPEDEARFRSGELVETELSLDRIHRPILPGTYFGYCPILAVGPGHQAATTLLLSSFIDFLETEARRGVLLHGIGTISCSAGGEQICRDLGMVHLRNHQTEPTYGVWELTGVGIANSIFARRSPFLRQCYCDEFGT